jgi:ferredoxin
MTPAVDPALTPPQGMTRFMVDPEKCIGCEACNNGFPKAFKFDRGTNLAFTDAPVPSAEYVNDEVTGVCPTNAIYVVGAPPPSPEELAAKEQKAQEHILDLKRRSRTIEDRIQAFKREGARHGSLIVAEDPVERDRRYGLVYRVEETPDAYVVLLEFPRQVPDSHVRRKLGIGSGMPDYAVSVKALDDSTIEVHGRITDLEILKLAGVSPTASFPPQFLRPIRFPRPVGAFRSDLKDKLLVITVQKR